MADTTNVTVRMDKDVKEQAENLFSELGMNLTTALNIFMRQSVRQHKIPFEIALNTPNAETLAAIKEVEDMESGKIQAKSYSSFSELLKEIEADV